MFIVKDVLQNKDGNFCAYIYSKEWMGRAYTTTWNVVFFLPLALMIVLYARVVRALWFHGEDDNQLTHQQKVSVTYVWSTKYFFVSSHHVVSLLEARNCEEYLLIDCFLLSSIFFYLKI